MSSFYSGASRRDRPLARANWIGCNNGLPVQFAGEYLYYTDAHSVLRARFEVGPYSFLNTFAAGHSGRLHPSIVLRCPHYCVFQPHAVSFDRTDDADYHGGGLLDEIAALASLCLGARVQPGGMARIYDSSDDPMGRPQAPRPEDQPALPPLPRHPIVPQATQDKDLADLAPLADLPSLSADDAVVLVRAARSYQSALWISEEDPALAWLMFVSAIEAAADQWLPEEDLFEKLERRDPGICADLQSGCGDKMVDRVAKLFAKSGVAGKFEKFLRAHLPPPPDHRPPEEWQHDWSWSKLKRTLNKVYDYRSIALHEGKPFPPPMCDPPWYMGDAFCEIPHAEAEASNGGVWRREDTPLLLHTFEYITRRALLKWWAELPRNGEASPPVVSEGDNDSGTP